MAWAQAPYSRSQLSIFSPTLDDTVPEDHAIRQLDIVLNELDWSDWEADYAGYRGQPPIHPRLISGIMLYGILRGIRSSRKLEDGTRNRIDFMWFLDGRSIDHSTFANFRQKNGTRLKGLFRDINRAALRLSQKLLMELSADGTKMRANASRDSTRTAARIEKYLDELDLKFAKAIEELAHQDTLDNPEQASVQELQKQIAALDAEKIKYNVALKKARSLDKERKRKNGHKAKPARVPVTDPESQVLPNKEGGYAPNYTPTAIVDKDTRLILAEDVVEGFDEASCVVPGVESIESDYQQSPEHMSMDGNLASGQNLKDLDAMGIKSYSTVGISICELVIRDDYSKPVPQKVWDKLPTTGTKRKKLDRSAFVFDPEQNRYWCPMGHPLLPSKPRSEKDRKGNTKQAVRYQCKQCGSCPIKGTCLPPDRKTKKGREINRDQFEDYRDQVVDRMGTEEGHEIYKSRKYTVETIFGYFKGVLGVRQFLLRGLENVRTEWRWLCTAYNLRLLMMMRSQAKAA